jgi:tRNA threonylcarbamoyladenosine biosynthesis protein TsaE
MRYKTTDERQTIKIAADLAKRLKGGEMILLFGDLGTGKTVFAKALARALGVKEIVKSPTFNIMKCYSCKPSTVGRKLLCHIDAYRLKDLKDLLDIGADEYLGKKNVISAVEWADRVKGIERYGGKIIKIKIWHGEKENERIIEIDRAR